MHITRSFPVAGRVRGYLIVALAATAASLLSCVDILPPPPPPSARAEMVVVPDDTLFLLPVGGQLTPTVRVVVERDTLFGARLRYESLNPSLAQVDSMGTITGVWRGRAGIKVELQAGASGDTATSDTLWVKVVAASLTIVRSNPDTLTALGDTDTLAAVLKEIDGGVIGDTARITWTSLDTSVATVDSGGVVRAVKNGRARLMATSPWDGLSSQDSSVVVSQHVGTVTVTPDSLVCNSLGPCGQFAAVARDRNGHEVKDGTRFTWTTSPDTVATIDTVGKVTARKNGMAAAVARTAVRPSSGSGLASGESVKTPSSQPGASAHHPTPSPSEGPVVQRPGESWDSGVLVPPASQLHAASQSAQQARASLAGADSVSGTGSVRVVQVATTLTAERGEGQMAQVKTPVDTAPAVKALDAQEHGVAGVAVTFTPSGDGAVDPTGPVLTDTAGVARLTSWTLGKRAADRSDTLTAQTPDLGPALIVATATPGPPDTVSVVRGDGQRVVVGTSVPVPPAVLVKDQWGNRVVGQAVTFTASGNGVVEPAEPVATNADGEAGLTSWTLGTAAGVDSDTLTAFVADVDTARIVATATPPPPNRPTGLVVTVMSATQIHLEWTDGSDNEEGFQVERCTGSGCTGLAAIDSVPPNTTTYENTGLEANTYRYRVRAYHWASYSDTSNVVTAIMPPGAPTDLAAEAVSSGQITLTWNRHSTNEDGFAIERCTGKDCLDFVATDSTAAMVTTYQDGGLTPLTWYRYRIYAFNSGGNSGYAGPARDSTPQVTAPEAPTNLTATPVSWNQIDLTWTDAATNEAGFEIRRCSGTNCTALIPVDSVLANVTAHSDMGLTHSTPYRYLVRAYNVGGYSSNTDTASATTPALLRRLSLTATGTGSGTVTSSPSGINCTLSAGSSSGTCNAQFVDGTLVTLTAVSTSGHVFVGCSPADVVTTTTCQILMNQDRIVAVRFEGPRTLTVSGSGSGNGTVTSSPSGISCTITAGSTTGTCSAPFVYGTMVTLTRSAASGHTFTGWSGACGGTGTTCQLTMDQDRNVTAVFEVLRTLTVLGSGSGNGSVTSNPSGISCTITAGSASGACSAQFPNGTIVRLSASDPGAYLFTGWSGACVGDGYCDVTMDQNRSVTATFEILRMLTVTVTGSGNGTVTGNGLSCAKTSSAPTVCSRYYLDGTPVTLAATFGSGHEFTGWSGGCTGRSTCSLTMDRDQGVTATFASYTTLTVRLDSLHVINAGDGGLEGSSGELYWTFGAFSNWTVGGTFYGATWPDMDKTRDNAVSVASDRWYAIPANTSGTILQTEGAYLRIAFLLADRDEFSADDIVGQHEERYTYDEPARRWELQPTGSVCSSVSSTTWRCLKRLQGGGVDAELVWRIVHP